MQLWEKCFILKCPNYVWIYSISAAYQRSKMFLLAEKFLEPKSRAFGISFQSIFVIHIAYAEPHGVTGVPFEIVNKWPSKETLNITSQSTKIRLISYQNKHLIKLQKTKKKINKSTIITSVGNKMATFYFFLKKKDLNFAKIRICWVLFSWHLIR